VERLSKKLVRVTPKGFLVPKVWERGDFDYGRHVFPFSRKKISESGEWSEWSEWSEWESVKLA